jgi:hypothetical protein
MNTSTRHIFSRHPRERGDQYSRDAYEESRGSGVLDRPVKPDDDSPLFWLALMTPRNCARHHDSFAAVFFRKALSGLL